jgi:hypothetical protein
MADIQYIVTMDASGALKSIKDLDGAINQAAGTTAKAGGSSGPFGSLFAQFTAGTLVASALQKGMGALKDIIASSITNAIEAEQAENNLKAALEITGRTVEGNIQHYKKFAAEQLKVTTYTDEQVMASQTLLLQLTSLDQKGLDRATKGAMGLASTMGIDLHSATMMVTKAMEGNYGALGRVGIRVSENLTGEQKQTALLDQLEKLYQRSTKETETFGGAMKQLANNWDELKEAGGKAILETEGLGTAIVALNKAMSNFVASGAFTRFLGQLERFPVIRSFSDALKLLTLSLELESAKADHAAKVNAGLGIAIDTVGKTFAKAAPLTKIFGIDFAALVGMFTGAPTKINEVGNKVRELTAAEIKAAKEAADAYKKLGDAAAAVVAKYNPLLGAMMKLKAEQDTLTKAWKAGAMSADAYDKAMAANAKAMKDVGLEAGKSAKAQGEIVKAAQEIINRYNPMHAAMVKAIDDEKKLDAALKAGVITDKAYAKGLESIHKDLDMAAKAAKDAKAPTAAFAASIQDVINHVRPMNAAMLTAIAREKAATTAYKTGNITLKEYIKLLKEITKDLKANDSETAAWVTAAQKWVDKWVLGWAVGISAIEAAMRQSATNKLAILDEEYQARLDLINNSVMNEEEKEAAITALDAEYNMKRRQAEVKAAQAAKITAIAMAIINVAEGVTKALSALPPPFNIALAAITAAAGAIQIALIKSQPIGAAKGAIFKQKALLMSQTTGQEYEVAEGGEAEIVSSPRQLREAIMGKRGKGVGPGQPITLHNHIYIDGKEMKTFITKTIRELSKAELMQIHPRAIRAY